MAAQNFISQGKFRKLALQTKQQERDVKKWTELAADGTIFSYQFGEKTRTIW